MAVPNQWSDFVDAWEVHDSAKVTISLDHIECEVKLNCAWLDRHELMMDLMGMYQGYTTDNSDGFDDTDGYQPTTWPYMDGDGTATAGMGENSFDVNDDSIKLDHPPICYQVLCEPVPGKAVEIPTGGAYGGTLQGYDLAQITAKFSTNQEQDLLSEEIEWNSQTQRMNPKLFVWQDGVGPNNGTTALTPEEAPGRILYGATLHRTLYRLPFVSPAVGFLAGQVNKNGWGGDGSSTSLGPGDPAPLPDPGPFGNYSKSTTGLVFAAETLLFQPATVKRTICVNGDPGWNLSLRFQYNVNGWNKFWRSKSKSYQYMYLVGDSDPFKPFPPGDFSEFLF